MRRTTTHSILFAALACLAIAPTAGAQQPEPQASLPDIEDEVMCPVCGTLLELASEAPQAQQQRAQIRDLIAQGYTKDEIKDALVAEYGEDVLATPDTEGFDLAAWLVPGLAFIAGAVAIFVGLRRWRRNGPGGGDEPDGGSTPDAGESKRLDEDLARYDL
jgi:cytochrome c-type biogenesis protein CcmH